MEWHPWADAFRKRRKGHGGDSKQTGFSRIHQSCVCQNRGYLITAKKHKRVFDAAFCFGKSAALRVPAGDFPACLLSKNFSYLGSELSKARYVPHRLRNSLIPKLEEGESCSQWADSCCLASCPLFSVVSSRCSLWRLGSSWLFWKSPGHMVGDIARSVWPIAQTKLRKSILLAGRTFNKEIRVGLSSILYLCLHASRSGHAFNFVWWVVFFLFHWIVACMPMSTTCKASVKPLVTTTPGGWGAFSTAAFHFADGFGPFEFCHFCFRWFLWQIWLCAGLEPAPLFLGSGDFHSNQFRWLRRVPLQREQRRWGCVGRGFVANSGPRTTKTVTASLPEAVSGAAFRNPLSNYF